MLTKNLKKRQIVETTGVDSQGDIDGCSSYSVCCYVIIHRVLKGTCINLIYLMLSQIVFISLTRRDNIICIKHRTTYKQKQD